MKSIKNTVPTTLVGLKPKMSDFEGRCQPFMAKGCGTDKYGRILAAFFVNGKNVNLEMIKAGLAEVYQGTPAPGFDNNPYWDAE